MQEVSRLIVDGDFAAINESDDLLQCDSISGGLYDRTNCRFGFQFFVDEDEIWNFDLDDTEIALVASGVLKETSVWKCHDSKLSMSICAQT